MAPGISAVAFSFRRLLGRSPTGRGRLLQRPKRPADRRTFECAGKCGPPVSLAARVVSGSCSRARSGDDEHVAWRDLDDPDGDRAEDCASQEVLAASSDDDEIGIGGPRALQEFLCRVSFLGEGTDICRACPREESPRVGEQLQGSSPGSRSGSATPSEGTFGATATTTTLPCGPAA